MAGDDDHLAVPNMQIRIDSPSPATVPGEVQVSGANVFLGYYKNADGYLYLRGRSKCMILGPSGQNIYPEEIEGLLNNLEYVVDSLVIEDAGALVALIYPDWPMATQKGMDKAALEAHLTSLLPAINRELPNYSHLKKFEFMPEDFERTPKRSIKRYIYQRK